MVKLLDEAAYDEVALRIYENNHQNSKISILQAYVVPLGEDSLEELRGRLLQIVCETLIHGLITTCHEEVAVSWNHEQIKLDDDPEHYGVQSLDLLGLQGHQK